MAARTGRRQGGPCEVHPWSRSAALHAAQLLRAALVAIEQAAGVDLATRAAAAGGRWSSHTADATTFIDAMPDFGQGSGLVAAGRMRLALGYAGRSVVVT